MWIGKVISEERGTTEDLGCEPRCPNDTLAIKRRLATGDRRSQSVESRSHALLWDPYCGIGIKEDPVSIFNRFYLRIISTFEISLCTSSVLHSRMLIERNDFEYMLKIYWLRNCVHGYVWYDVNVGGLEGWIELHFVCTCREMNIGYFYIGCWNYIRNYWEAFTSGSSAILIKDDLYVQK